MMKKKNNKKKLIKYLILAAAAIAAAAVLIFLVFGSAGKDELEEAVRSIRNAVMDKALQCYVIEGAYPSELSYLEENYGLIVNTGDYYIDYKIAGENLPPQITVVPKN